MRMMRMLVSTVVVTTALAVSITPAAAEERTCRGTLGTITVDNLRVPSGASCTLQGTTVKGTVKVESKGTLVASRIRVVGNVQAENAARVVVRDGSRVGGSVQIVQGGAARVVGSAVNGDILYDENRRALAAVRNVVGGNVQAFQNSGGVEIRGNRIDGNLQCKANSPAPVGGNNRVDGSNEDQCASL